MAYLYSFRNKNNCSFKIRIILKIIKIVSLTGFLGKTSWCSVIICEGKAFSNLPYLLYQWASASRQPCFLSSLPWYRFSLHQLLSLFPPATEFSIYFLVALILLTILSLSVCLVSWSFFPPLSEIARLKQSGLGRFLFLNWYKVQNCALAKSFLPEYKPFYGEASESVSQYSSLPETCEYLSEHFTMRTW